MNKNSEDSNIETMSTIQEILDELPYWSLIEASDQARGTEDDGHVFLHHDIQNQLAILKSRAALGSQDDIRVLLVVALDIARFLQEGLEAFSPAENSEYPLDNYEDVATPQPPEVSERLDQVISALLTGGRTAIMALEQTVTKAPMQASPLSSYSLTGNLRYLHIVEEGKGVKSNLERIEHLMGLLASERIRKVSPRAFKWMAERSEHWPLIVTSSMSSTDALRQYVEKLGLGTKGQTAKGSFSKRGRKAKIDDPNSTGWTKNYVDLIHSFRTQSEQSISNPTRSHRGSFDKLLVPPSSGTPPTQDDMERHLLRDAAKRATRDLSALFDQEKDERARRGADWERRCQALPLLRKERLAVGAWFSHILERILWENNTGEIESIPESFFPNSVLLRKNQDADKTGSRSRVRTMAEAFSYIIKKALMTIAPQ